MLYQNPTRLNIPRSEAGKRGGNTEGATKKDFSAIPYFLDITYVGETHLIFEKNTVLPKVFSTNCPIN